MKKLFLLSFLGCLMNTGIMQAQDILLKEDFEEISIDVPGDEESAFSEILPAGWSTIDTYDGNETRYRWSIYYYTRGSIGGTQCASCDGAMFGEDGAGPREEILLTPELDLTDTYQLTFRWKSASAAVFNDNSLDFQVRVTTDNGQNFETIWSFRDKDQLKASGVLEYPWTGWAIYQSQLDLSKWKGQKIKVAFVYKMLKKNANVVYLDDITVKQFTPATQPQIQCNKRSYNFGELYIGAKRYSEIITIKNIGTDGLTISEIKSDNKDFSTTIVKEDVKLDKNESYDFQLVYEPTLTSSPNATIEIVSNGGTATITAKGTKLMLDEDYTYEGFEKENFPPVGWNLNHERAWSATSTAFSGDQSAYASVSLEGAGELLSPRLDLSKGEHKIAFNCYEEFYSETGETMAPENSFTVDFSTDGGSTWKTIWTNNLFNELQNVEISLGSPASDNCFLKWTYGAVEISSDYIPETSIVFLDDVILPPMYGRDSKPAAVALIYPENGAVDLYNKDLTLKWKDAQFAQGYKLYVGTSNTSFDVLNGKDLGTQTTYTFNELTYNQTYFWKVVPYNEKGDAEGCPVWSFTIMADQSINTYPWSETFENETFPPLGWRVIEDGYLNWDEVDINPYDGKKSVYAGSAGYGTETILETPAFQLPDNQDLEISFYWGNNVPVNLKKDPSGLAENTTTEPDEYDAGYFEIYSDGTWQTLKCLSDKNNPYWVRERIGLEAYQGKSVVFRWRYVVKDYMHATAVALDNVKVEETSENKAVFNVEMWNAGVVNYQKNFNSGDILTLINDGIESLSIKQVSFESANFSSSLQAGTEIEPKKGVTFNLTFQAGETSATVKDQMTVVFENGYSVNLPVEGIALPKDTRYYDFEQDEAGSLQPKDFTTIDVDRKASINLTGLTDIPHYGEAYAFMVMPDDQMNNVCEPVSGKQVLCAMTPDNETFEADDWIISCRMKATSESVFRFYARNWESVNSVLPGSRHNIQVLVSTTGNTSTEDFEEVMPKTEMPYYNGNTYDEYKVELGKYAGQYIYIALRHTVTNGLAAFFDDFYFEHFDEFATSIESQSAEPAIVAYPNPVTDVLYVKGAEQATITLTSLTGTIVRSAENTDHIQVSDLNSGIYLLTVKTNDATVTTRIMKK